MVFSLLNFQEGEEIIQDFFNKVKAIPISTMTEAEILAEVEKLKSEVEAKNNPYVMDILARKSTT